MTSPADNTMLQMTALVLDRLEAWRAGDQGRVARIDARVSKDQVTMSALWAAAFGIAERTLNVLEDRQPGSAADLIADFRGQLDEYRRS